MTPILPMGCDHANLPTYHKPIYTGCLPHEERKPEKGKPEDGVLDVGNPEAANPQDVQLT